MPSIHRRKEDDADVRNEATLWALATKIVDSESQQSPRARSTLRRRSHRVDPRAHWIAPHQPGVVRLQKFGRRSHIHHSRIKPQLVVVWIKYDWHPVVNGGSRLAQNLYPRGHPRTPNPAVCGSTSCGCRGRDPFGPPRVARVNPTVYLVDSLPSHTISAAFLQYPIVSSLIAGSGLSCSSS